MITFSSGGRERMFSIFQGLSRMDRLKALALISVNAVLGNSLIWASCALCRGDHSPWDGPRLLSLGVCIKACHSQVCSPRAGKVWTRGGHKAGGDRARVAFRLGHCRPAVSP